MIPKFETNHNSLMSRHFDSLGVLSDVIPDLNFEIMKKMLVTNEPEHDYMYWYHKDHLGSSTQISDYRERVIHHIEYMPSGEQFSEQRDIWATPYKFNGKELDAETGLYYYGARYYTPEIGIWLSVDPLSDKYPHQSNYMYCSGRLVNVIDPDGRDEWEFDMCGNVVNRIQNDKKDAFHIVDDNGKRLDGKSIEFEKGTVNTLFQEKTTNSTIFDINGDDNAEKLFKFFDKNTEVEWNHDRVGVECNSGNFITTSHQEGRVANVIDWLGFFVRQSDHNHPSNNPFPSNADKKVAKKRQAKNPHIELNIHTKTMGYSPYDSRGTLDERLLVPSTKSTPIIKP